MSVVVLAPFLVARGVQRGAVRHHDVVTAVGGGVERGLVLAHEQHGNSGCQAAQGRGSDVGLGSESWVRC